MNVYEVRWTMDGIHEFITTVYADNIGEAVQNAKKSHSTKRLVDKKIYYLPILVKYGEIDDRI